MIGQSFAAGLRPTVNGTNKTLGPLRDNERQTKRNNLRMCIFRTPNKNVCKEKYIFS